MRAVAVGDGNAAELLHAVAVGEGNAVELFNVVDGNAAASSYVVAFGGFLALLNLFAVVDDATVDVAVAVAVAAAVGVGVTVDDFLPPTRFALSMASTISSKDIADS